MLSKAVLVQSTFTYQSKQAIGTRPYVLLFTPFDAIGHCSFFFLLLLLSRVCTFLRWCNRSFFFSPREIFSYFIFLNNTFTVSLLSLVSPDPAKTILSWKWIKAFFLSLAVLFARARLYCARVRKKTQIGIHYYIHLMIWILFACCLFPSRKKDLHGQNLFRFSFFFSNELRSRL